MENKFYEEFKVKGKDLVDKVKAIVHEGNARRIILKDEKGQTFLEIPLSIAAVGGAGGAVGGRPRRHRRAGGEFYVGGGADGRRTTRETRNQKLVGGWQKTESRLERRLACSVGSCNAFSPDQILWNALLPRGGGLRVSPWHAGF
jgi:hypothetical protein